MPYRILALMTVLSAFFCLASCKESDSTTSSANEASQSTPEPMDEPVVTSPVVRAQPLALGETAPDFTLSTPGQESFHLADRLEQGPMVLTVLRGWPGYQCPICTRQVGEFLTQAEAFKSAGTQVLFVYPGPSEQLAEHSEEFFQNTTLPEGFSFVIDPDYSFTNLYGLRWDAPRETAYPSTFVIDTEGVVQFAKVSDDHGGRAKVAEVLQALDDLN